MNPKNLFLITSLENEYMLINIIKIDYKFKIVPPFVNHTKKLTKNHSVFEIISYLEYP